MNLPTYLLRHVQAMLYSLGQLWRTPVASMMTVMVIGIALALPAGKEEDIKGENDGFS
jgi:cell division transport system permease protein